LQSTAIAEGEAVEGDFIYKDKNHNYTFPGGVALKAAVTLYLVDHSNQNSTKLDLEKVKNYNFDALSISFGNPSGWDYKDEVQ